MLGITDPSEEYFKDGLWGWSGSAWRKAPLWLNYTSRLADGDTEDATGASSYVETTAVPAGEVHVVQALSIYNAEGAATNFSAQVRTSTGITTMLANVTGVAAYIPLYWTNPLVLAEGDQIRLYYSDAAAGESLVWAVWGYKVTI